MGFISCSKDEAFELFMKLFKKITIKKDYNILKIKNDHDIKFKNHNFKKNYFKNRIDYNFLAPMTPQQNGVVERKNMTLQKLKRIMLCESNLLKYF